MASEDAIPDELVEVNVGKLPDCDFCGAKAVYDGKTKPDSGVGSPGCWAYMCEECWAKYGIGHLGWGKGQRLKGCFIMAIGYKSAVER